MSVLDCISFISFIFLKKLKSLLQHLVLLKLIPIVKLSYAYWLKIISVLCQYNHVFLSGYKKGTH